MDDDEDEENVVIHHNRIVNQRINYHLTAPRFRESFRIDIEVFAQLEQLIGRFLPDSDMNNSLAPREQILTALHFIGNNAYYHVNGQVHGVSRSTVFRCVHRVCSLIATYIMPMFIRWPTISTFIEREFYNIAGFPNVKGVVDGTLIQINAPSQDEPTYVARNNKHAINVVLVAGPKHQFFFVSARSPGSFHDARAIRISNLWRSWENERWRPDNDNRSIILADSAYPLTSWLIPPIVRMANANMRQLAPAVPIYERLHRKTRFIVECAIGILKNEYPCLKHLRIRNPTYIAAIIYSCVTLHNMQNNFHRGSYAYDSLLNQLTNPNMHQQIQPIITQPNQNIPHQNDQNDGIIRQRQILQYFLRR